MQQTTEMPRGYERVLVTLLVAMLLTLVACNPEGVTAPGAPDVVNGDERMLALVHELRSGQPDPAYLDELVRSMYADHGPIEASGPVELEPFRPDGSRELSLAEYPEGWYDPDCDWDQLYTSSVLCALSGAGAYAAFPTVDPYSRTAAGLVAGSLCMYQAYNNYCVESPVNYTVGDGGGGGGAGSW